MKKHEEVLLDKINHIIRDNLQNPDFQLSDLTKALAISRTKLYRKILKLTGEPPNKYIRNIRLEKAKKILEVGIYPTVKETAMKVGFRNADYFSKLFSQKYQILPKDLLKN